MRTWSRPVDVGYGEWLNESLRSLRIKYGLFILFVFLNKQLLTADNQRRQSYSQRFLSSCEVCAFSEKKAKIDFVD